MKGLNKVILIGNVGSDPKTRYLSDGSSVSDFRLATSDSYKNKETGELVNKTQWHRIVCYRRLSETVAEYVKKGSRLYLEGKIESRKYTDKETNKENYIHEIVANSFIFLDKKDASDASSKSNEAQHDFGMEADLTEDDIPF